MTAETNRTFTSRRLERTKLWAGPCPVARAPSRMYFGGMSKLILAGDDEIKRLTRALKRELPGVRLLSREKHILFTAAALAMRAHRAALDGSVPNRDLVEVTRAAQAARREWHRVVEARNNKKRPSRPTQSENEQEALRLLAPCSKPHPPDGFKTVATDVVDCDTTGRDHTASAVRKQDSAVAGTAVPADQKPASRQVGAAIRAADVGAPKQAANG